MLFEILDVMTEKQREQVAEQLAKFMTVLGWDLSFLWDKPEEDPDPEPDPDPDSEDGPRYMGE